MYVELTLNFQFQTKKNRVVAIFNAYVSTFALPQGRHFLSTESIEKRIQGDQSYCPPLEIKDADKLVGK